MPKRLLPPLIGSRVRLRLLTATDLPLTRAWRNQDHIRKWFLTSHVINPEQHAAWFRDYTQKDTDFVFIIEEMDKRNETHDTPKPVGKPIGQISLYKIEWQRRRAEYGRLMIGESQATGRGLAKEATQLLLRYGFQQLGLEEIKLETLSHNTTAIGLYQACGFRPTAEHSGIATMRITAINTVQQL